MNSLGGFDESSPLGFRCPNCDEEVEVAPEFAGQLARCPFCDAEFFASHDQSHLTVVDDTPPETHELNRESTFDRLRIENYTALRMGAIRARSWWIIGVCLSAMTLCDMIGKSIIYIWVFHRWGVEPTIRVLVGGLALTFARGAWRRAAEFKREIDRSAMAEPTVPPDFSTLSDGSEQWKNLENIR